MSVSDGQGYGNGDSRPTGSRGFILPIFLEHGMTERALVFVTPGVPPIIYPWLRTVVYILRKEMQANKHSSSYPNGSYFGVSSV